MSRFTKLPAAIRPVAQRGDGLIAEDLSVRIWRRIAANAKGTVMANSHDERGELDLGGALNCLSFAED